MNKVTFFMLAFAMIFCGCAASVSSSSLKSYPPKLKDQNIDVYGLYDNVPQENEVIGTVEYDDTGFSIFCGYSDMLKSFINETREMGGDALKITIVKEPDYHSTCYRGTVNVLKYKDVAKKDPKWLEPNQSFVNKVSTKLGEKNQEWQKPNQSFVNDISAKLGEKNPTIKKAKAPTFVAILETTSGGVIKLNESRFLTNVLREEAVKILPSSLNYTIMTRENILAMLPPETQIENCEGACLVETGRNISANYVAQAQISTFGSYLTISVELYDTTSGKLISSFNAKSIGVDNLELEIRRESPKMFQEILNLESLN